MVWRGSPGRGFAASRDELVVFLRLCSLTLQPGKNKDSHIELRIHEESNHHESYYRYRKLLPGPAKKNQFSNLIAVQKTYCFGDKLETEGRETNFMTN